MSNVGAPLELINLICTTLVFIRDVTSEAKDSARFCSTFEETLIFLGIFADVAYGHVTGLLRDIRVHRVLTHDIEVSLYTLNRSLAAHREAWRYISTSSKSGTFQSSSNEPQMLGNVSLEANLERKKWRDEMKQRSQLWREKARPGLYRTLFGSSEIQAVTLACEVCVQQLRQTLELILLTIGPPSPEYRRSQHAAALGIKDLLGRQHRAGATPSGDYNALQGYLREMIGAPGITPRLVKTVYIDGEEEIDVLVEPRSEFDTPTEFMCHLTWLLQAPLQMDPLLSRCRYQLHTLGCIGFIDDPLNNRSLILYRAPKSHPFASNPLSLHDLITQGPTARLSLGARFIAARDLAATLLETHASGWIHGNIQSRSVAMLLRDLNDRELSPYLIGWGVLQPLDATSFNLETNLYRHHDRFGKPTSEYGNGHDIYSLGIVLLELGLWRIMASIFARRIERTPNFVFVQQEELFLRVHNTILDWANSIEIEREMGKRYSEIVLKCLTWQQSDPIESMIEFRNQVVDALADGCIL